MLITDDPTRKTVGLDELWKPVGVMARAASIVALALLTGMHLTASFAGDSTGNVASLLSDPLRSVPEALALGVKPPGSVQSLVCLPASDLDMELSLRDAVHMALCANPKVQLAWIAIKTQANNLGQARSSYLPKVNASARRLNDSTWLSDGRQSASTERWGTSASVSMIWRLLDFGTRGHNVDAANDLLAAALATHDAVLQQTMASVIQAYFDVQAAQALLDGRQASLALARSTQDTALRKVSAGSGSMSESLQTKTAMARAMLEVSRAEGSLAQAQVVLANAIAVSPESRIKLPVLSAPDRAQLQKALQSWLSEAKERHPAITAARLQEAAAKAQVKSVRADGLPSLDLMAAYYRNGRPEQGLSSSPVRERQIGVVLNIPLFEGFERTYRIRSAETIAEQRQAELRDVELKIATEVAQAYAGASAALTGLEASDLLLQSAKESQASSNRRYQHGVADVLEVLSTQQALADAQQQRSRSVAEWHAASLRLVAAAGRLGMLELEN